MSTLPAIGSLWVEQSVRDDREGIQTTTYLPRQYAAVEAEVSTDLNESQIRGDLLSQANVDQVTIDQLRRRQFDLVPVPQHKHIRREHALDRRHNSRRGEVLPCVERRLQDKNDQEHHRQRQIGSLRIGLA